MPETPGTRFSRDETRKDNVRNLITKTRTKFNKSYKTVSESGLAGRRSGETTGSPVNCTFWKAMLLDPNLENSETSKNAAWCIATQRKEMPERQIFNTILTRQPLLFWQLGLLTAITMPSIGDSQIYSSTWLNWKYEQRCCRCPLP